MYGYWPPKKNHVEPPPTYRLGCYSLQTSGPPREPPPGSPKPQKCIKKSENCHVGPPGSPKSPFLSKNGRFWTFSMTFEAFIREVQNVCLDFKCTFGISGFRGSVGGPGDCNASPPPPSASLRMCVQKVKAPGSSNTPLTTKYECSLWSPPNQTKNSRSASRFARKGHFSEFGVFAGKLKGQSGCRKGGGVV